MANNRTGLLYFKMDTDKFRDTKIRKLKMACGCEGYCVYDYILHEVYRENGCFVAWDENAVLDVAEYWRLTEARVCEIVEACCRIGLFHLEKKQAGILTGVSIQRRYLEMCAAAKRKNVEIPEPVKLVETPLSASETSGENAQTSGRIDQTSRTLAENSDSLPTKVKQSKVKKNKANAAGAAGAREAAAAGGNAQVHSGKALASNTEAEISQECLERFRAYCDRWNALVGKPRIPPDIRHYAEIFAVTEQQCRDTAVFARVIEHLQKHPQNVICTGKITLKATTIFTVDFVTNVLANAYDTDFSQKQKPPDNRRLPWGRGTVTPPGGYKPFVFHFENESPQPAGEEHADP